ncbi:protoporphyrinogen oxidase, partial [bacterium]|nr:protoporphyrinogen oxidase [candidate division CSSED10-310 bacterium]
MFDVTVIGGGISGLLAAWKCHTEGYNVVLLEAKSTIGGNVQTLTSAPYRLETGPHSFMGSSEYMWKLINELKIQSDTRKATPISKFRYIYRNGLLHVLPMNVTSFLTTQLLSPFAKLRLMMEPIIPSKAAPGDTAWDFFVRRFGQEAASYLMSPFVSGIYAGDVKKLGAKAAFPKFWSFENEHGSMILGAIRFVHDKKKRLKKEGIEYKGGLFSFNRGLGTLTEHLADRLAGKYLLNSPVKTIEYSDGYYYVKGDNFTEQSKTVILATPPSESAGIIKIIAPKAADNFKTIPMAPVTVIHWAHKKLNRPFPLGFGFLVPRHYDLNTLGTLFPSQLFPDRSPQSHHLFASFYGGMHDPEVAEYSDTDLINTLIKEHSVFFHGCLEKPEIIEILRYTHAIPQLLPDHSHKLAGISSQLSNYKGIFLAGNYLTGVG